MAKEKTFKKIILDDLKAQGLGHIAAKIFSVRYNSFSGGDSVDVTSQNLFKTDREKLESILREYQAGSFNSMEDIYEYDRRSSTKERQAKYVSLRNEFSQDVKDRIKAELAAQGVTDDRSAQAHAGEWFDTLVWRGLSKLEG